MPNEELLEKQRRVVSLTWDTLTAVLKKSGRDDLARLAGLLGQAGFTPAVLLCLSTPLVHTVLENMAAAGAVQVPKKYLDPALISELKGVTAKAASGSSLPRAFTPATKLAEEHRLYALRTGLSLLDSGHGLPPISILLAGPFSSGKTQLATWLAAAAAAQGRTALVVDTENGFNPSRLAALIPRAAERLGVEPPRDAADSVLVAKAGSVAEIYLALAEIPGVIGDKPLGLVVVDSVSAPIRGEFSGRGQRTVKDAADALKPLLKTLEELASIFSVPVVAVNQVYEDVNPYAKVYKLAGGNVAGHMNNAILFLRRAPKAVQDKLSKALGKRLTNPVFVQARLEKYVHRESILAIADEGVYDVADLQA